MKKRVKAGTSRAETAKRKALFVQEMIKNGGNGTQAAIAAGYSQRDARNRALRLLKEADISRQLEEARAAVVKQAEATTGVSVERTLLELSRIAYFDPGRLFDESGNLLAIKDMPEEVRAAIAQVEHFEEFAGRGDERELIGYTKKLKLWDKNSAIDKAMKHLGLFEKDNEQLKPMVVPRFRVTLVSPPKG